MIFVQPDVAPLVNGTDTLRKIMALDGKVYSTAPGRKTIRIDVRGRSFFLKAHYGVGWKEIFKNILQLKIPVVDAGNEWRALEKLKEIGVPTVTVVAYGKYGRNPAKRQSFIMTNALHNIIDLESFCRNAFLGPLDGDKILLKRTLIRRVASIARQMHQSGINHQDFYLVHFLLRSLPQNEFSLSEKDELLLFDLHRARIRRKVPARAVAKDLAGLYFSSLDVIPLTQRDLFRFIRAYRRKRLRDILAEEGRLWLRIEKRARNVYCKFHGKEPEAAVLKKHQR